MSPTERIILGHKAWRKAARLLRERCQRLRANRDTWRHMCDDRAICGICHDVLQQENCDDFDRPWVPREDWAQARTWAARWKAVAHRWRRAEKKMKCVPAALRVSVLELAQRAVEGASIRATMRAILALSPERQDLLRRLLDDILEDLEETS